jgi:hypothetical protein
MRTMARRPARSPAAVFKRVRRCDMLRIPDFLTLRNCAIADHGHNRVEYRATASPSDAPRRIFQDHKTARRTLNCADITENSPERSRSLNHAHFTLRTIWCVHGSSPRRTLVDRNVHASRTFHRLHASDCCSSVRQRIRELALAQSSCCVRYAQCRGPHRCLPDASYLASNCIFAWRNAESLISALIDPVMTTLKLSPALSKKKLWLHSSALLSQRRLSSTRSSAYGRSCDDIEDLAEMFQLIGSVVLQLLPERFDRGSRHFRVG